MPVYIKDEDVSTAIRALAARQGKSLTETVHDAIIEAARREDERVEEPLSKRLEALAMEFAKYPKTGKKADKAFYDWLSGEEDDVR
jgi:antitoxin VapB